MSHSSDLFIKSAFHGGEVRIEGMYSPPEVNGKQKQPHMKSAYVDGYHHNETTGVTTLYEYQGCWWHGCQHCYTGIQRTSDHIKRLEKTHEKIAWLEQQTKLIDDVQVPKYVVVQMWAHDWLPMRTSRQIQTLLKNQFYYPHHYERLNQEKIIEYIKDETIFGFVECDIEVPSNLYEHFQEYQPLAKNIDIGTSTEEIGEFMHNHATDIKYPQIKQRTLIASYFAKKILLATPLVKWYLDNGLIITHVYEIIQYKPDKCFKDWVNMVTDGRRLGDVDVTKKIIADLFKLIGNSSYGRLMINRSFFTKVIIATYLQLEKAKIKDTFKTVEEFDQCCEITSTPETINVDMPVHVAHFVYQYAKLRMLKFYFECIDRFIDRSRFQYTHMDTDSAYLAINGETLYDVIKPEKLQEFNRVHDDWFPRRDPKWTKFDLRRPAIFKLEKVGIATVALNSKCYYVQSEDNEDGTSGKDKMAVKGANLHLNKLNLGDFSDVLNTKKAKEGVNRGFIQEKGTIFTYKQDKNILTFMYKKRIVQEDGISTKPTML
jgi:hypothetical protein